MRFFIFEKKKFLSQICFQSKEKENSNFDFCESQKNTKKKKKK
jgi:hypothetical protein